MQFKNFGDETAMKKYQEIASKLNFAFEFIKANFDEEELKEFLDYIKQVDTVLPLVNPEVWDNHYQDIEKAEKRVKVLLSVINTE